MKMVLEYETQAERERLIAENSHKFLVEERNIIDGNFLVFDDEAPPVPVIYVTVPQEEIESIKQDSTLLKAQSKALSDRAEFTDEVIAEMALELYK